MELTNCKKIHFASKKKAKEYISKWRSQRGGGRKRGKLRIYRCIYCNGYHFSSCDAKQTQSIKENRI